MVHITIDVTGDYNNELRERLHKYEIGQGDLAREMGISAAQVSRWMTSDMVPRMDNIRKIEVAIVNIRLRRQGRGPIRIEEDDGAYAQ